MDYFNHVPKGCLICKLIISVEEGQHCFSFNFARETFDRLCEFSNRKMKVISLNCSFYQMFLVLQNIRRNLNLDWD